MTSFRQCNLRCCMCGAGYYSASPRDTHGDPCGRCGGMLSMTPAMNRFSDRTYVGDGIDALERFANGVTT